MFTPAQEQRIRELIAEYFRQSAAVTSGGGTMPYREYLATRDEPPAAPPICVINTTERL